jgi:alkyldihydroxyacetonephosphate synthase
MKWWGWGDPARDSVLPEAAQRLLQSELGTGGAPRRPVALEEVRLGDPALPEAARQAVEAVVGTHGVRDDRVARVGHAAGKGYQDLVRVRAGDCQGAPDAVVYPESHVQVRAVLVACQEQGVAVVPFGGGTSVVGGVEPLRGGFGSVIALDLGRMDALGPVDRRSLTALLGPGLRCPEAEARLAPLGLTLGHFPQSFEYASVGGCVATRSAGQASTGYGRIDELVLGLRCATPGGELDLRALPASAAGPDLRQLVVGSEGILGVITEVALRVRPAPAARRFEGWFFRDFEEGVEALRVLEQEEAAPDVARLSDEPETRLSLALAGGEGLRARLGARYLRLRGYEGGCLVVAGWEGEEELVAARAARTGALLRRGGGLALGRSPGEAWAASRYDGPYLRDALLDHGVLVETLETAAQWSGLLELYGAVRAGLREALGSRGTPPLVMCHVSHLYPSGASLYFTFLARAQEGQELAQWEAAKRAAGDAIAAQGATITHHHAVGRDHLPWMEAEVGTTGLAALGAVKEELDPAGIMNPGKLVPGRGSPPSAG